MAVQIEGPEYSQQHTPVKRFYTSRHCDFQLLALRDAFIAAAQDYKFAAKRSGIPAVAGREFTSNASHSLALTGEIRLFLKGKKAKGRLAANLPMNMANNP
jgi:hypothetical protein